MHRLHISIIQTCSSIDQQQNFIAIAPQVREAMAQGANLISLPEAVNTMSQGQTLHHYSQHQDPFVIGMQQLAREGNTWLHLGSVIIKEKKQLYNRTLLIDPQGKIDTIYNKIHMFDIELEGKSIRESDFYTAGKDVTIAQCPWGKTGLSICYDLRFPLLYRQLAQSGCRLLMIPAAFTWVTGKAHWHSLLRARAIENSAWVIAANQCNYHQDGRRTYGHSLVINPWGEIVAEGGESPQQLHAQIDLTQADTIRQQIPAWNL